MGSRLGRDGRARKWRAAEIGHDIRHGKIRHMSNVLIYGDTLRSAEMRHEIPLVVPDPFLFAELDGHRHVVIASMEAAGVRDVDTRLTVHPLEEFGWDELIATGLDRHEAELEVQVRACRGLGLERVAVPSEFPLELADRLRAAGLGLAADHAQFATRRRVKNEAELEGIRRAQRAAEAGMHAAVELLR